MKNSFLFVAYQFPPMGGPGVQRSYNFVKELSNQGYSPIVLTINEVDIDSAKYQKDLTLLENAYGTKLCHQEHSMGWSRMRLVTSLAVSFYSSYLINLLHGTNIKTYNNIYIYNLNKYI